MNSRQLGRIRISHVLLREDPDIAAKMFGLMNFVPVNVSMSFSSDVMEYTGISDRFDEIEKWAVPPVYSIEIEGIDEVSVIRAKGEHHGRLEGRSITRWIPPAD